jgi:predicted RNA-binding Zn-ribbon protein involved in translation (DUF1610 family)
MPTGEISGKEHPDRGVLSPDSSFTQNRDSHRETEVLPQEMMGRQGFKRVQGAQRINQSVVREGLPKLPMFHYQDASNLLIIENFPHWQAVASRYQCIADIRVTGHTTRAIACWHHLYTDCSDLSRPPAIKESTPMTQPRVCEACGTLLPAGAHGLQRYCLSCKVIRRKAKATRLQRSWRARHPGWHKHSGDKHTPS